MSDSINKLEEFFAEDLMVRIPINSFAMKHLTDKVSWIDQLVEEGLAEQAEKLSLSHLERSPHSIYGLFFLMMFLAKQGKSYVSYYEKLIQLFTQHKKSGLVIYVSTEILKIADSDLALKTLATHYQHEGMLEELVEIWERLLKIDLKDHALPFKIAVQKEKLGLKSDAIRYFKMAFFRALEQRELPDLYEIWRKLVHLSPEDVHFFNEFGKKISPLFSGERQKKLYEELIQYVRAQGEAEVPRALSLVKENLKLDPENSHLKDVLLNLYRTRYKQHSQLEAVLALSGLLRPWKNAESQIELFEKYIRFDKGSFVFHKTFGFGLIQSIVNGLGRGEEALNTAKLTLDFKDKKNHSMTMRIALSSLSVLNSDDVQALAIFAPDRLKTLASNPEAFCLGLVTSYTKGVSSSDIKALLTPQVMTAEEFSAAWKEIKSLLEQDSRFEIKNKLYILSQQGTSYKDDLLRQLSNTRDPEQKIKVLEMVLMHFRQLDSSFDSHIAAIGEASEKSLTLLMALGSLEKTFAVTLKKDIDTALTTLVKAATIVEDFEKLNNASRLVFLDRLTKLKLPEFPELLVKCFFSPSAMAKGKILEILRHLKADPQITEVLRKVISERSQLPEHFLLALKFSLHEKTNWVEKDKLMALSVEFLKQAHFECEKDNVLPTWKRTLSGLQTYLLTDGHLLDYLATEESKAVRKPIFDLLAGFNFLEDYLRVKIKELSTKLA